MAKQSEEAEEKLANKEDIDLERIRELMGPPPLEAASSIDKPTVPAPQKIKIIEEHKEATTAPELDPEQIKQDLSQNLAVSPADDVPLEVINNPEENNAISPDTVPEENASGIVSSEDYLQKLPIVAEIEDESTDDAVDDIVSSESDELLAVQDAKKEASENVHSKEKKPFFLKRFISWWWRHKITRIGGFIFFIILILGIILWPSSRYFLLNTAGVRSRASIRISDESNTQPLKNVEISLGGQTIKTDQEGNANLAGLRHGKTKLIIKRRAYATQERDLILGWGSNPLGDVKLTATGTIYLFVIQDYLSGKPLQGIELDSGEFSALSDKEGKVSLAIDDNGEKDPEITLDNPSYRKEVLIVKDTSQKIIPVVPRKQHVFVSKRSGNYDLYKIDIDGKNESVLLAGTGKEREDMAVVSHPLKNIVAYVSTRDGQRNKDGYLLSSLYTVNVDNGERTRVALSERVQVVDWAQDRLVYVAISDGASASNPDRHKLLSYDVQSEEKKELASTNFFNDVISIGDSVYYAPSNIYKDKMGESGLFKIKTDGLSKQTIFDKETWNVFRTEYDKLVIASAKDWYDYKLGDKEPQKLLGQPANIKSRLYIDSPGNKTSLWVDERDGKGVLLGYDLVEKKDKELLQRPGIKYPVYWLNDSSLVFRISDGREVADYVMSIDGGEVRKIKDVTNTGSVDHKGY